MLGFVLELKEARDCWNLTLFVLVCLPHTAGLFATMIVNPRLFRTEKSDYSLLLIRSLGVIFMTVRCARVRSRIGVVRARFH